MARPTDFSAELGAAICDRIAGGKSLRAVCAEEDMPDKSTVLRWLCDRDKVEFRDQYARARELQADVLFDECLAIADDSSEDYRTIEDGEGPPISVVDHEHISRARLRVDTRKFIASKLAPKKYGERVALTGADGGPIATRDETASTPARVVDDLKAIFGADLLARPSAQAPARRDRVVRHGPRKRRRKKS